MKRSHTISVIQLIFGCLFLTSCSVLIAQQGQYPDVLKDGTPRKDVIAKMGEPESTIPADFYRSVNEENKPCIRDAYTVTGKIPEPNLANQYMNASVITLGLAEIIFFPVELIRSIITLFTTKQIFILYCKMEGSDVLWATPWHY